MGVQVSRPQIVFGWRGTLGCNFSCRSLLYFTIQNKNELNFNAENTFVDKNEK
jgi:hypothetical protein